MQEDKNKNDLRSVLMEKSVAELEELLALDFIEDRGAEVNTDYIFTILEVIEEKEGGQREAETQAAWKKFLAYRQARGEKVMEAGVSENGPGASKKPRKYSRVLRHGAIAAAVIVLLCGTAFGWNIFQAIADWTTETFHFLTTGQDSSAADNNPFESLRLEAADLTDVPAVPNWAPAGTDASGKLEISANSTKTRICGAFLTENGEFTIRLSIYDEIPEEFPTTYQKDDSALQEYEAGGVVHYIMSNHENTSAMWTNSNLEVYIQGKLTQQELLQMIDSIYEE